MCASLGRFLSAGDIRRFGWGGLGEPVPCALHREPNDAFSSRRACIVEVEFSTHFRL
jgi:hypothetical protein